MSKSGRFPPEVVRHWPEVFKDVEIQTIPVEYLVSVRVEFKDGKMWEIDLEKTAKASNEDLESSLATFFDEYSEHIVNIDFRLDTQKVIKDVKNRTRQFLKKRK